MFQKKIKISKKITIKIEEGNILISTGNKNIDQKIPNSLKLTFDFDWLILESNDKAILGLYCSILKRKLQGIVQNFKKILVLKGLGFKVFKNEKQLTFKLGYSHDVIVDIPSDIKVELLGANQFILYSHDWEKLTQFCANLKRLRKINPYKGKGLLLKDEIIKLKEGKKK